MATCKGCGRDLVTYAFSGRCVFCGRKANVFRAAMGEQPLTRRGAVKAARKQVKKKVREAERRADAAQRAKTAQRAERERAQAELRAERERAKAALRAEAEERQARVAGLTWQQAERLACEWMRANGYPDARLTASGADGGVDVQSLRAIGQVKRHSKPVGLAEMQRIHGIAQSVGKNALFFSTGGFTPKAKGWASAHHIEMYEMPPVRRIH